MAAALRRHPMIGSLAGRPPGPLAGLVKTPSNVRRKPSQPITASNRLNGLPLASSHCTRSSTSKNPRLSRRESFHDAYRKHHSLPCPLLFNYPELFTQFPEVPFRVLLTAPRLRADHSAW